MAGGADGSGQSVGHSGKAVGHKERVGFKHVPVLAEGQLEHAHVADQDGVAIDGAANGLDGGVGLNTAAGVRRRRQVRLGPAFHVVTSGLPAVGRTGRAVAVRGAVHGGVAERRRYIGYQWLGREGWVGVCLLREI